VRIRTITRAYLENVGIQFLSLRQHHRHRHASPAENGRRRVLLHDVKQPASRPPPRSTSRSRGAFSAPGLSRRFSLSPPHLRCLGRCFGRARAQILGVSCSSDPEMRGRRSAGRRTTLIRRAGKTRPHACEACPSRATGTSASRRSTVALPGPRCVSGISAGAGARLARRPSFMAGYGPRVRPRLRAAADATPAPPSGSSLETPLMSEMTNPVLYIRYVVKK
jgi:hypothetical protein